jgi:hypothetical protein
VLFRSSTNSQQSCELPLIKKKKQTSPETNGPGDVYKPTHKQTSFDYGLRGSFSPRSTAIPPEYLQPSRKNRTSPETNAPGDVYKPTHKQPSFGYGLRGSFSPLPTANSQQPTANSQQSCEFPFIKKKKQTSPETNAPGDEYKPNHKQPSYGLRGSFSFRVAV